MAQITATSTAVGKTTPLFSQTFAQTASAVLRPSFVRLLDKSLR